MWQFTMGFVYDFGKENEKEKVPSTLKEYKHIFTDQNQFPSYLNAPHMLSWVISHQWATHINKSTSDEKMLT